MCTDTFITVKKSMIFDKAVTETRSLLLYGWKCLNSGKCLKGCVACGIEQAFVSDAVKSAPFLR